MTNDDRPLTIWHKSATLDALNQMNRNTLSEHLGMKITELGQAHLLATMPVEQRTMQPMGLLHGGASAALAESLGSMAGYLAAPEGMLVVGQQINAHHLRPARSGMVTAKATAVHLGRSSQVWQIDVVDENDKLCCSCRLTLAVLPEITNNQ
ncbi:hotdog fold thioesterase [Corallincola spongiicola]|uniref:Hotdog fold thioesterase n=1 Tax=Corallincola spongiicola TaxID=2520508 RepID=A0ABY1WNJ9_9GAMM|nr:hotdog fold thioesterase [Corallincola spongiicola]TAA45015.1 hotdog fold thioesterase [Corallincola spongiicola]